MADKRGAQKLAGQKSDKLVRLHVNRMGKKVKKESDKVANDDVFEPVNIESRNAHTVVLMLSSTEEDVLVKACDAIYRYVAKSDENKKQLLDLNAVVGLVTLIQHEERSVRKSATTALAVMASHADVRKALRKQTEAIPAIVALLAPDEDSGTHEFATLALLALAQEYTGKAALHAASALAPLVRCLASPDPDIQKNSVETIALMLQDYQSRGLIRELNSFPPLLELLKSDYPVIQYPALVALERATLQVENRTALQEIDGVNRVIEFIGQPTTSDLHVFAVMVLANCLDDPKTMEAIKETGGLQKLIAFITDQPPPEDEEKKPKKSEKAVPRAGKKGKGEDARPSSRSTAKSNEKRTKGESTEVIVPTLPEVKEHAAKAIARAAKNAENRRILHETEVEKMLILLLAHEESSVTIAAAQAIAVMAENVLSRDWVGRWDGIEPLIKLIKSDNPEVREASALTLANLSTANPHNVNEIARFNGLEPLIMLLGEPPESAAANAAVAITNLTINDQIRAEMQALGVVAALVEPIKSEDCTLQNKACMAIAAFTVDAISRQSFRESGGVEPLVKLLLSNDADVRRSASWATYVSAADEATAMEISAQGGLDILLEMKSSETRRNAFTDMALTKILGCNLSAKYALTGRLAFNDVITDGFFDAGQLMVGSKFITLAEHAKSEVDAKRAVLVVNAKPIKPPTPVPMTLEGELGERQSKTTISSGGRTSRGARDKTKSRGGQRAANQMTEEKPLEGQPSAIALSPLVEDVYMPPGDPSLMKMVDEVQEKVVPLPTTKDQVVALAQMVATRMGGAIDNGQLSNFSWELAIGKLKYDNKTNLVNIGSVKAGIHYHRALLFKALGDRFALGCTLVRGDYTRAWNEIQLTDDSENNESKMVTLPPKCYIVDLIYQPGRLLALHSREANLYQRL